MSSPLLAAPLDESHTSHIHRPVDRMVYVRGNLIFKEFFCELNRGYALSTHNLALIEACSEEDALNFAALGGLAALPRSLRADEEANGLVSAQFGRDAVAIVVSRKNPLRNLSTHQVQQIMRGEVREWDQFNLAKGHIVVAGPLPGEGLFISLEACLGMAGNKPAETYRPLETVRDIAAFTTFNTNTIGILPLGLVEMLNEAADSPRLVALKINDVPPTQETLRSGQYPLAMPLNLVTHTQMGHGQKRYFEYLVSAEGQELVEKYFLALHQTPPKKDSAVPLAR